MKSRGMLSSLLSSPIVHESTDYLKSFSYVFLHFDFSSRYNSWMFRAGALGLAARSLNPCAKYHAVVEIL